MEFHRVQAVGQRENAKVDWLGMLTKLCLSLEGSSLSADGESVLEMLKEGLVSKGLVEKAGDEPVSISDASRVMYPGSESVPSGVMCVQNWNSGKSNLSPLSKSGSCGA